MNTDRERRVRLGIVITVSLLATALRIALMQSGPDLDSDSYGHAVIGRMLPESWWDVRRHWVWLPLWHFVHAGVSLAGGTMRHVQALNLVASFFIPVLVLKAMDRPKDDAKAGNGDQGQGLVATLAGAFTAICPLMLDHGQSAEPEPLFTVLILAAVLGYIRRRFVLAGAALALACLLRYEAWVVTATVGTVAAIDVARSARRGGQLALTPLLAAALPCAAIGGWIFLGWRATGEWMQFLRINREFAIEARRNAPPGGPQQTWLWYPYSLPRVAMGNVSLFAVVGIVPLLRHEAKVLWATGATLLAFVSYGWVRGHHLGLDRHAFSFMPFYVAAMAHGAVLTARFVGRAVRPLTFRVGRRGDWLMRLALASFTLYFFVPFVRYSLRPSFERAREAHQLAWPEDRLAASLLAAEPTSIVFCDLPRIEVMSGLGPDRFIRWNIIDVQPLHAQGEADRVGTAFVVSAPRKFAGLGDAGTTMFRGAHVEVRRFSRSGG